EEVAEGARGIEVLDVATMQEVETPVGEDDLPVPWPAVTGDQLLDRQDLLRGGDRHGHGSVGCSRRPEPIDGEVIPGGRPTGAGTWFMVHWLAGVHRPGLHESRSVSRRLPSRAIR